MQFDENILKRLEHAQIEHNDACEVITSRDTPEAFHYLDPPYVSDGDNKPVNQGHYSGYSETDYQKLLETLSQIQGKFLLSSYPSKLLSRYTEQHGWYTKTFEKPLTARKSEQGTKRKTKTEVLTANYPI